MIERDITRVLREAWDSFDKKINEAELDFGDDAVEMSKNQVAMDAEVDIPIINKKVAKVNEKMKMKWKEARGFIKPNGTIERIGDMRHHTFAMDVGYNVLENGKMVNKKYKGGEKGLCIENGLIRWSPEAKALTIYYTMTPEQIKTIKDILKAYGYVGLSIEYLDKAGKRNTVEFEGDPREFEPKIQKIQHFVNDNQSSFL